MADEAGGHGRDLLRRAFDDDAAAGLAALGAEVDHPIGGLNPGAPRCRLLPHHPAPGPRLRRRAAVMRPRSRPTPAPREVHVEVVLD